MIRERRIEKSPASDSEGFLLRGTEVSRLEGISDAVFGLAITLIVVSLKAPSNYSELMDTMRGFIGSSICALLLMQIWNRHYLYFRRYALEDGVTRSLNSFLLILVIAYVYPLKFLYGAFVSAIFGIKVTDTTVKDTELPGLFVVYGFGFAMVYFIFGLMYGHAKRNAAKIGLSPLEILQTKWIQLEHWLLGSIGLVSVACALTIRGSLVGMAGFAYFLVPVVLTIHGSKHGDAVKKLKTELAAREAPSLEDAQA